MDLHGDPPPACATARLGSMRLRHWTMWPRLAFSPDGRRLATLGWAVRVWDVETGRLVRELPSKTFVGVGLAFAPDGTRLAPADDEKVLVWDLATGKGRPLWAPKFGLYPLGVAFSPDGRALAAGCKDRTGDKEIFQIRIYDSSGRRRAVFEPEGAHDITALTFSPDGKTLAFGAGPTLRAWDVGRRKEVLRRKGGAHALAFSPDGKWLASGGAARPTFVLEWRANKVVGKPGGPARALKFTPDGKALLSAAGGNEPVLALDPTGARRARELLPRGTRPPYTWFSPPVLSGDGKRMALMDGGVVRAWDLNTGRELSTFDDHRKGVPGAGPSLRPGIEAVASPDGRRVATASPVELLVWDAATGRPLKRIAVAGLLPGLRWSPDGRHLVAGAKDRVGWWDAKTGGLVRQVPLALKDVERVSPSSDGARLLCVALDAKRRQAYRRLSAATGKEELPLLVAEQGEGLAALSPDGNRYVTRGTKAFSLRDARTGRALWTQASTFNPTETNFSADGRLVVTGNWPVLQAFESATGRALSPTLPPEKPRAPVEQVCISPDGRTAAVVREVWAESRTRFQTLPASRLVLFEVATGRVRRTLPVIDGQVSCAFTPDGGKLVSASTDGTALVWDVYAPRARPKGLVTPDEARRAWEALASHDAERAFDVVCRLGASPAAASVLGPRLKAAKALDKAEVKRLLAELGPDGFDRREAAAQKLTALGEDAEPLLRAALKASPELEVKRRIERVLQPLAAGGGGPVGWQRSRAVEALERAGSPDAVRLLRALAGGATEARLTREARAALDRLRSRGLASK
jgi:WD40 repeat protein